MSYATLEKKLRTIPEDYLDEVSKFVEFLLFKINMPNEDDKATDLSKYFGAVKMHDDGLKIQREIRNEWD